MCAYNAKDGSRHHSASRARMHDMNAAEKPAAKPADKAADGAADMGGGGGAEDGQDVSNMPIHEVVAQHGPAHKVEIEHDHEAGKHTKTSHHGKHKHVSEHETAEEAHDHGAMAAGAETPEEEAAEEETPDDANRNLEGGGEEEMAGQKIPGMS